MTQVSQDGTGLTARIAGSCANALAAGLPVDAVEKTKSHLLDTLAAMVSGATMKPGLLGREHAAAQGGTPEATVVASPLRTTAIHAALANAMAAHADETDDSHAASITHPGCAVVPAAVAVAERQKSSGGDLLKAVALGYDITAAFGRALGGGRFLRRGWDSHAFAGTLGAAAAAGALLTRDAVSMAQILSYAAQQASGLVTLFRDRDHVEKAFVFAGMPARDGVTAAILGASGWTGVGDVFDGAPSFFSAFSDGSTDPEPFFAELGHGRAILETNVKRWSVGSPIQGALDALEAIIADHEFGPGDVSRLRVTLPEDGARIVDGRGMPDVNLQYLCAVMLLDGTVSFAASHDHARMTNWDVVALREKVALVGSAELQAARPPRQAIVEIDLDDGRTLRHHARAVRGTSDNPMSAEEIDAKALDLMGPVLGAAAARQAIATVREIENAPAIDTLVALLRTA